MPLSFPSRPMLALTAMFAAMSLAPASRAQTAPPPNPPLPAPSAGAHPRRAPPAETCRLAPGKPGQAQKPKLQDCDGIFTPPHGVDPDMQAPAPAPHPEPMPVIPPSRMPPQPPRP